MNRFLYAAANPSTLIDPTGHFATAGPGGGGGSYADYMAKQTEDAREQARSETSVTQRKEAERKRQAARDDRPRIRGSERPAQGGGFDPAGPFKWMAGFGVGAVESGVNFVGGTVDAITHPEETVAGLVGVGSVVVNSVVSGKAGEHFMTGWNYWWADKHAATNTGDAFQDGRGAASAASDVVGVGLVAYGAVGLTKGAAAMARLGAADAAMTAPAAIRGAPKLSPKFKSPTNPPQLPPDSIPPGMTLRVMPPAPGYPNGYWVLEKPMPNGKPQPIDPSTGKPGSRPETHVPLPGE